MFLILWFYSVCVRALFARASNLWPQCRTRILMCALHDFFFFCFFPLSFYCSLCELSAQFRWMHAAIDGFFLSIKKNYASKIENLCGMLRIDTIWTYSICVCCLRCVDWDTLDELLMDMRWKCQFVILQSIVRSTTRTTSNTTIKCWSSSLRRIFMFMNRTIIIIISLARYMPQMMANGEHQMYITP